MDQESQNSSAWYQQGDVTIKPVAAIPTDATATNNRILAEGEATGHKHFAEAADVRLFLHQGTLYMRAPSGTTVVHEEHHAVAIPPGDYQIGIVREFDHFKEEERRVID
jgi:urease alpha subunit